MEKDNLKNILDFLTVLKDNNNREWFNNNKDKYEVAKNNFHDFVENLIPVIREIDAGIGEIRPKDCIFRIYKDTRFSKDKTPYKTNMGAFISKGGRKSAGPGYYIHIEPGSSFFAGGVYQPPPDILNAVRKEIYFNSKALKKIIEAASFKKVFGTFSDDQKLKKAPKGFPPDFPDIELLKHKNYIVVHYIKDAEIESGSFTKYITDVCKAMYPLNGFLYHAIQMSVNIP